MSLRTGSVSISMLIAELALLGFGNGGRSGLQAIAALALLGFGNGGSLRVTSNYEQDVDRDGPRLGKTLLATVLGGRWAAGA